MTSQVPPCEHCRQPIRKDVYYEQDGKTIRAWHMDRPECWAAAQRDGSSR